MGVNLVRTSSRLLQPGRIPMTRYQTQAVLRRTSHTTPLALVGVTLDHTFYPSNAAEASGTLSLAKGLVALAPLTSVEATDPVKAAAIANLDAGQAWTGLDGPGTVD